jgi:hypothetical protein
MHIYILYMSQVTSEYMRYLHQETLHELVSMSSDEEQAITGDKERSCQGKILHRR